MVLIIKKKKKKEQLAEASITVFCLVFLCFKLILGAVKASQRVLNSSRQSPLLELAEVT